MSDAPFAVYHRRPAPAGANQARVADSGGFGRVQQPAGSRTSKCIGGPA
jgi:hypothetical protein